MTRTLLALGAVFLLSVTGLSAHHAFAAEYDATKSVTISGTVTGFEWTNPHVWLRVEGDDESTWSFEMGSPNGLLHRGWRKAELKNGDHVTVTGFRAKDGRTVANARIVTLPDGRKLFGGFQSTPGSHR